MRRTLVLAVFSWLVLGNMFAQDLVVQVKTRGYAADFEGILALPSSEDMEFLGNRTYGTSSDGSARSYIAQNRNNQVGAWVVAESQPGLYSFFLHSALADDDFGTGTIAWTDDVAVRVSWANQSTIVTPALRANGTAPQGTSWHVFDYDGSSGTAEVVNRVLPVKRLVYGEVVDGVSGELVPGVRVRLYSFTGELLDETETNGAGVYFLFPPSGTSILELYKEEMIGYRQTIYYGVAEAPVRVDGYIVPPPSPDQLRFVLSWDRYPLDLDLHVTGPGRRNDGRFHLSYSNMQVYNNQHFLDLDDRDGNGPETITLNRVAQGDIRVSVHDYSNIFTEASTALGASNAVLRVFGDGSLLQEIPVPRGSVGNLWSVASVDDQGTIRPVGRLSTTDDPGTID